MTACRVGEPQLRHSVRIFDTSMLAPKCATFGVRETSSAEAAAQALGMAVGVCMGRNDGARTHYALWARSKRLKPARRLCLFDWGRALPAVNEGALSAVNEGV